LEQELENIFDPNNPTELYTDPKKFETVVFYKQDDKGKETHETPEEAETALAWIDSGKADKDRPYLHYRHNPADKNVDILLWSDLVRDGNEHMIHAFLRLGSKRLPHKGHVVAFDELKRIMKDKTLVASFRHPENKIETGPERMKREKNERKSRSVVLEVETADDSLYDLDLMETQDALGSNNSTYFSNDDDDETRCSDFSDD
jgi:hypothetical protein